MPPLATTLPPSATRREREAVDEIARTVVGRAAARLFFGTFLMMLLSGAALELAAVRGRRENLLLGDARLQFPSLQELRGLWQERGAGAAAIRLREADVEAQNRIERESRIATAVRPRFQALLSRGLRFGNSQVLMGHQDWLFYRDDFDYVTGPPFLAPAALARRSGGTSRHPSGAPDPLPALLGLAGNLRSRGIDFLVVPVPTKLGVAWERFLGRRERAGPALSNPSREEFLARLRNAGVEVFDPAPILRAMELRDEKPYMQFDSHWSPAGFDRVAAALAGALRGRFDLGEPERFHREAKPFERRADLGGILGLDTASNPYLLEPLQILHVDGPGHRPYNSRRGGGRVLLVGDSFSRLLIRNRRKGGDANFAAQLAFHLETQVDMLAENDAGVDFARRVAWLRQPHVLEGRRVVIYQIAERALALGDWTPRGLDPVP